MGNFELYSPYASNLIMSKYINSKNEYAYILNLWKAYQKLCFDIQGPARKHFLCNWTGQNRTGDFLVSFRTDQNYNTIKPLKQAFLQKFCVNKG